MKTRVFKRTTDELLNENAELRAMLDETRNRNYALADENFQLRRTLKLANEQVIEVMKKFDKLKKDMGYG